MISDPESVEKSLKKMPEGPVKEDIKRRLEYQKEVDYALELIKIAEEDLESSKILFENKKYPNSVSSFQQSVEKSTKAFFLLNEILKSRELQKAVGHFPSKKHLEGVRASREKAIGLKKAIDNNPKLKEIPMIKKLDLKDFLNKATEAEKIIKSVSKNGKIYSDNPEILDQNLSEMGKLLLHAEEFEAKKLDKLTGEKLANEWVSNIKAVSKIKREEGSEISEQEEKEALSVTGEFLKHLALRNAESMIYGGTSHAINFTLNFFVEPHFNFLRYPGKKNPLECYTLKNPLVERLPKFIKIQRRNLDIHKKYLEFIKNSFADVVIEG